MEKQKIIGVIGASNATSEEEDFAYAVGKLIAEKGYVLACGGKGGVMEAACKGTSEVGGTSIGILPLDDRSDSNSFLTISIPTGVGYARNKIVADTAHAIIAVGGAYGTLSEIAYALIKNKKVFAYNSWSITAYNQAPDENIINVKTPQEAVEKAIEFIQGEACQ